MERDQLIQQILALSIENREQIVQVILESLPPQLSPDEQKEILQRAGQFQTHPEAFLSWEHVKERLAQRRRPAP